MKLEKIRIFIDKNGKRYQSAMDLPEFTFKIMSNESSSDNIKSPITNKTGTFLNQKSKFELKPH